MGKVTDDLEERRLAKEFLAGKIKTDAEPMSDDEMKRIAFASLAEIKKNPRNTLPMVYLRLIARVQEEQAKAAELQKQLDDKPKIIIAGTMPSK
jgi:hypothetical protein